MLKYHWVLFTAALSTLACHSQDTKMTTSGTKISCLFAHNCVMPQADYYPSAIHQIPQTLHLDTPFGTLEISALTDRVFRIRATTDKAIRERHSFAVIPQAHYPKTQIREEKNTITLSTALSSILVNKESYEIQLLDQDGKLLQEESQSIQFQSEGFKVTKVMHPGERFYGLGDKAGQLNHNGKYLTMWNKDALGWQENTDPLYKSIPFFIGLQEGNAYGVFLDHTSLSYFDFTKSSEYSFGAHEHEADYYLIAGPSPKDVITSYTELTGRMPLPPLWSLGFHQSRYSYDTEILVKDIARRFKDHQIPLDAIYLDIDFQDGNKPFTYNQLAFPHFKEMIKELKTDGIKIVTIVDPHIKQEPGYTPYDEGLKANHFTKNADGTLFVGKAWPGDSVFPDFFSAEVRKWWGSLFRHFIELGVAGFWNDMNEPAVFHDITPTLPMDALHRLDNGQIVTHKMVHNAYGLQNAKATYEGLRSLSPHLRPFVLTRSVYPGAQRYAATWTGDTTSSWEHLHMMTTTLLNLGISGMPFAGCDIGGFLGWPSPELLTRWIELGVFTPYFRIHSNKNTPSQEPWAHGEEHTVIRKKYIELRYRLLPYIYTWLEEASRTGIPLMRPFFLEYPQDEQADAPISNHAAPYFFGPSLLIIPVDQQKQIQITLPAGTWYNYWTGETYIGGSTLSFENKLEQLPILVKAGSIIPMQPVTHSTSVPLRGPLTLKVYPGENCQGSLYIDDGESFEYQKGNYRRMGFSCALSQDKLLIDIYSAVEKYPIWWNSIKIEIPMLLAPKNILINKKPVQEWNYNEQAHLLSFSTPKDQKESIEVLF